MKISETVSESQVTFSLADVEDQETKYAVLASLKHICSNPTLSDLMSKAAELSFDELKNVTIMEEMTEYRYHFLSFEMVSVNDDQLTYEYKMSGEMILIGIERGTDHDRY